MSDTDVKPAKPTPHQRSTSLAPFRIGEKVTIRTDAEDAVFVAGQHGIVSDVEHDPADAWGPWIIRVLIPGVGTLAFQPSELRRRAS